MARPTVNEFVEAIEALNTREEVATYIQDIFTDEDGNLIGNKNHFTAYRKAIDDMPLSIFDASLIDQLHTKTSTKPVHCANTFLRTIQAEVIEQKTKSDEPQGQAKAMQAAAKSQDAAKTPIDAYQFVRTAADGLTASNWRVQLLSVCLLTGRRLGAVAYEAVFESVNPAMLKVTSGQKQRGAINTVLIPVLADATDICIAVNNIRTQLSTTHRNYALWLNDRTTENATQLTNAISGSAKFKDAFKNTFKPLFADNTEDYAHALRAVYACIVGKCHQNVTGSDAPGAFVQGLLDHDSTATTVKYLDGHSVTNIDKLLETMPQEFITAMDANAYAMPDTNKQLLPFDIDAFLSAIGDESARVAAAALLTDPNFAAKLGSDYSRLYTFAKANQPKIDANSAASRIERIIKAIIDYNISQEGSVPSCYAYPTAPLINRVGQITGGKTFDSKTMKVVVDKMSAAIKEHADAHGIEPTHNLNYRRSNTMEEYIIPGIVSQHG